MSCFYDYVKKILTFFLQETHSTVNDVKCWNNEWGAKAIWSHHGSNSKGTSILFNSKVPFSFVNSIVDTNGRFVIVEIIIYGKTFTCINIYAPNNDCPQFFKEIDTKLNQIQCLHNFWWRLLLCPQFIIG